MFHGLTMVNFDGQTQNQMMVRPWSTMVDHGQPWSDGQTVARVSIDSDRDNCEKNTNVCVTSAEPKFTLKHEALKNSYGSIHIYERC